MAKMTWTSGDVSVKMDLEVIYDYINHITKGEAGRKILESMVVRYQTFSYRRFMKMSAGGSSWKRLSKRRVKAKGHALILQDTRSLLNVFNPTSINNTGLHVNFLRRSVEVGFSVAGHPSGMSFRKLAEIHTFGLGRNPQRVIMVRPDADTQKLMGQDTLKIINDAKRDWGLT